MSDESYICPEYTWRRQRIWITLGKNIRKTYYNIYVYLLFTILTN